MLSSTIDASGADLARLVRRGTRRLELLLESSAIVFKRFGKPEIPSDDVAIQCHGAKIDVFCGQPRHEIKR